MNEHMSDSSDFDANISNLVLVAGGAELCTKTVTKFNCLYFLSVQIRSRHIFLPVYVYNCFKES